MKKGLFIYGLMLTIGGKSFAQQDSITHPYQDTVILQTTTSFAAYAPPANDNPQRIYQLKPAIDVPLTALTAAGSLWGFSKIYSKDPIPQEDILSLKKENLNVFDRWAADVYHPKAEGPSDALFYGAMPLPLLLLVDKNIRKDAAKIGLLYLEAMSITGIAYTGSNYLVNRFRPLAYNPAVPMEERREGGSTNSFIAGHVALVATSTFFTAKVYSDYNPDSQFKYVLWGAAIASTGATAYLRHRSGKHFPTDLLVGTAVGTLSGILVPHFHKNKLFKNPNLSVMPFTGPSHGLALTYKFQ